MATKIVVNKKTNRKWVLTIMVIVLATLGTFVPPIINFILEPKTPLVILGSTEYVSLLTLIVGAYFAGNVWQRHVELSQGVDSYDSKYGSQSIDDATDVSANVEEVDKEKEA